MSDDAQVAQQLADDVLAVAVRLGFVWPPLAPAAGIVKALVDAGFAIYFRNAKTALDAQVAGQVYGVAAAKASAVTTQVMRERKAGARSLGYRRPADGGPRHLDAAKRLGTGPVPETSDLASLTMVLDQGSLGSCTAHGIAGAVRGAQIAKGAPASTPILSRLALYWLERAYMHETNQDAGAFIHLGFQALNTFGFGPETYWPYSTDDGRWAKQPPLLAMASAFDQRAPVDYQRILSTGGARVDDVKRALGSGHLVVFGTQVTETFCQGNVGPTGILQVPGAGDQIAGEHCMLWCSHDARKVRVVNSWGTEVFDQGRFDMSWDYAEWDQTDDIWIVADAPLYSGASL